MNAPEKLQDFSEDSNVFEKARENSIEIYDERFGHNSILTRSARMRKFKFYQYKPIKETTAQNHDPVPVLLPREDVVQGKVGMIAQQSKELSELDIEISKLEKRIADLNGNNDVNNLDKIFELVNQKNDLLRRQMQLNILEQEKALEKANEELTKELRSLLSIEDSKKTKAQLERQQYLYDQSLALVNKRNELVLHMDVQEKCIDDDNALKARLKTVISDTNNRRDTQNCCIQ